MLAWAEGRKRWRMVSARIILGGIVLGEALLIALFCIATYFLFGVGCLELPYPPPWIHALVEWIFRGLMAIAVALLVWLAGFLFRP